MPTLKDDHTPDSTHFTCGEASKDSVCCACTKHDCMKTELRFFVKTSREIDFHSAKEFVRSLGIDSAKIEERFILRCTTASPVNDGYLSGLKRTIKQIFEDFRDQCHIHCK